MSVDTGMGTRAVPTYCGQCGEPLTEPVHDACAARLELEPPRYCGQCARRMVVQVLPSGWTARCSEHGSVNAGELAARR